MRITPSAPVIEHADSGRADRNVGDAEPPGSPERVRDDNPDLVWERGAYPAGGRIRVERQEHRDTFVASVGHVDAGIGAYESVSCLADQHAMVGPQHRNGLVQDDL